nr:MAG TPA: hypothetical protein [Caudoviricetes sp.]
MQPSRLATKPNGVASNNPDTCESEELENG